MKLRSGSPDQCSKKVDKESMHYSIDLSDSIISIFLIVKYEKKLTDSEKRQVSIAERI